MSAAIDQFPVSVATDVPAAHLRVPYAEALSAYAHRIGVRAGVPGHLADPARGVHDLLGDAQALDISPLVDGIDADPNGGTTPLDAARALAADAWGARTTWFLTNGASQGNLTTCLALRHLGRDVVVMRSMHSSVTDGMALAGLTPHSVLPRVDAVRGMAHAITPADLDAALSACPRAIAAWVVTPSYFGAVADVAGLAAVAHRHGVPLIVDEAWGAHFGFHPDLPQNALRLGADVVISSTHKLGGSLGQSAMLHLGHGEFADQLGAAITRALRMTSSTSESSLLLASLDLARRDLMLRRNEIGDSIAALDRVRAALRKDPRYAIATDDLTSSPYPAGSSDAKTGVIAIDPLRLVVDTRGTGLTGHAVRHRLFHDHGVHVEMSTDALVVALAGAGSRVDADALIAAFRAMPTAEPGARADDLVVHTLPEPGPRVVELRTATFAPAEVVPADEAVGRVSAESLAAYPPGIPNVLPGERITAEVVQFLRASAAAPHGYVRGAVDAKVDSLRVLVD
jgi:arginine/lysine/ornithine decarboxylase